MTNPQLSPGLPGSIGVLGGGRMGAGIAHAFLVKGADVVVVERDAEAAAAARDRVLSAAAKSVERGAVTASVDDLAARLEVVTGYGAFAGRELVVEAVPEDWELKVAALRGIEEQLTAGACIASNTSSLSVTGLANELKRPEDFLGLHFFNPVPASTLIEVVLGERTSAGLAAAARELGGSAGEDCCCGQRRAGVRVLPPGGGHCPGGHADGGRGGRLCRRHRCGYGPGLQAPHRTAADHGHCGP